jgi:nucleotide-binding universal stress UspA family protein
VGTIVVGVDGSQGSDAALRWALAEAQLRGSSVLVVHAYPGPQLPLTDLGLAAGGGMPAPGIVTESADRLRQIVRREARNLIADALRRVEGSAGGGLQIEQLAVEGSPAQMLIDSAQGAELLVLGSRGRGGFLGLLLGSVSQQCAHHPPCPVVILPPPEQADAGAAG